MAGPVSYPPLSIFRTGGGGWDIVEYGDRGLISIPILTLTIILT